MNETTNKVTGETIKYNRIGGTPDNPIYFNDPTPTSTTPVNQTITQTPTTAISASSLTSNQPLVKVPNVQTQTPDTTDIVTRTQTQLDIAKQEADMLQGSVGTQAQEARKTLADTVKNLFTQRGQTQASQTVLEEQAGIADEQKALREVNTEIANTNIQLRAEQDRIRNTPMSQAQRAVEIGAIQDTFGRRLADLAIRQSASQGNISAIQSDAERKVKLALAPIENQIQYFTTFGKDNVDALTQEQQQRLNLIVTSLNKQKEDVKALEEAKAKAILEVVNNGGGRDTAVISAIQGAKDISSAYTAGGKYIGALDRQIKQAQLSKLYGDIAKDIASTGGNVNVNNITEMRGLPAETKNNLLITEFLKSKNVGQGTRTQLANILGVLNATKDLAEARQTAGFKGISPLNAILDAKIPFTSLGLPFRQTLTSKEGIENRQYLEAVNLKVQQWASGASLTAQQIEQVNRFTPRPTDTDSMVRTKINGLTNFMNSQVQSALQSEGVNFVPEKVNLFETYELIKKASPEQLAELKGAGLIE
jgi:hypothetical protein